MKKTKGGAKATARTPLIPAGLDPELLARVATTTLAEELNLDIRAFDALLVLAGQMQEQKRWKEAFELYAKLGLIDPTQLDVQIGLARCATELGEHDLAIKAAANVILLAPHDARGYLLSGKNCLLIGQYQEAREDLEDAMRLAGDEASLRRSALLLLSQLEVIVPVESSISNNS